MRILKACVRPGDEVQERAAVFDQGSQLPVTIEGVLYEAYSNSISRSCRRHVGSHRGRTDINEFFRQMDSGPARGNCGGRR
jgi:hypothetical protein